MDFRYNTCGSNKPTKGADTMYCTTLYLHKQIIVFIRRSLSLLVLVSLLLYPLSVSQEREVWHDGVIPSGLGLDDGHGGE